TTIAAIGMGFALFSSNVTFPQMLELPAETGSGLGMDMLGAALIVATSGVMMMVISPLSGWLERTVGPRPLFTIGAAAIVLAYVFVLILSTQIWHFLVANVLIVIGIGFTFAAMPMIIMRPVPGNETAAPHGLDALFSFVGTSTASAVMGVALAAMSIQVDGVAVPTREAFQVCFWLAIVAGAIALLLTFLIPRHTHSEERPAV